MKLLISIVLPAVLLAGCATTTSKFDASQTETQSVRYESGSVYAISRGGTFAILASPHRFAGDDEIQFLVTIWNLTDHDIEFSESGVSGTENATPMTFVSESEQERRAEKERTRRNIAIALAGAANSYNASQAGRQTYEGTYTVNGASGGRIASGDFSGSSYNYAAAQAAQTRANVQTTGYLSTSGEIYRDEVASAKAAMQRTTISPGANVTGWLVFDRSDADDSHNNIVLHVAIGTEVQELHFSEVVE